jgi:hypothetical protein
VGEIDSAQFAVQYAILSVSVCSATILSHSSSSRHDFFFFWFAFFFYYVLLFLSELLSPSMSALFLLLLHFRIICIFKVSSSSIAALFSELTCFMSYLLVKGSPFGYDMSYTSFFSHYSTVP